MPRINLSDLALVSRDAVGVNVFRIVSALDHRDTRTHEKAASVAAALITMCEALAVDPAEVLRVADRVIRDSDRNLTPELAAARSYMRHEL